MARPRKTTVEIICDGFADMTVDQQDGMLITLSAIHRQAKRRRAQLLPEPTCPRCMTAAMGQNPMGLCGDCQEDQKREDAEQERTAAEVGAERCPPKD